MLRCFRLARANVQIFGPPVNDLRDLQRTMSALRHAVRVAREIGLICAGFCV